MSEFETNTRNLLRSSEQLDDQLNQQLAEARSQALEAGSRRHHRLPSFMLPATGMALASVIALVLVYSPITEQSSVDDEALLSEGVELYEDLDFYQWLASDETRLRS